MNKTLMRKAFRDYAWLGLGAVVLLFGLVVVFVFAVDSLTTDDRLEVLKTPWIRRLISAMIGADIVDNFTRSAFVSFAFTHPLAWSLIIGFILTSATGLLSGEIEQGSFDLVCTLPVSRTQIYISYTVVIAAWAIALCAAIWVGAFFGLRLLGDTATDRGLLALVAAHLFAATLVVVGMGMGLGAICNRRMTAAVICFVIILYSFVINVVGVFWPAVESIKFTSFLNYYQPLPIARDAVWQWGNIAMLVGGGAAFWVVGWVWFVRRDLPGA